jgi:hypothetical protein
LKLFWRNHQNRRLKTYTPCIEIFNRLIALEEMSDAQLDLVCGKGGLALLSQVDFEAASGAINNDPILQNEPGVDMDGESEGGTLALFNIAMKKFDISMGTSMGTCDLDPIDMDASKNCSADRVMQLFESRVKVAIETAEESIEWEDRVRETTTGEEREDDEIRFVMGRFETHLINLE